MSEPRSLQFVDTNTLIYAHDLSAGQKHKRARELIRELWQSGLGCLSIQVLQEFYVNGRKMMPSRGKNHLPPMAALNSTGRANQMNSTAKRGNSPPKIANKQPIMSSHIFV